MDQEDAVEVLHRGGSPGRIRLFGQPKPPKAGPSSTSVSMAHCPPSSATSRRSGSPSASQRSSASIHSWQGTPWQSNSRGPTLGAEGAPLYRNTGLAGDPQLYSMPAPPKPQALRSSIDEHAQHAEPVAGAAPTGVAGMGPCIRVGRHAMPLELSPAIGQVPSMDMFISPRSYRQLSQVSLDGTGAEQGEVGTRC